jgi:type IX secretion system PorP/SprF family membrane protein
MKRLLTGLLISCVTATACFAQDIHFTQYTSGPMLLNPALTASWKDLQLTIQQKQQWQTVKGYSTSGLSFEIKASRFNWKKIEHMTANYKKKLMQGLAFGVNVYSDKAGDASMRTTNFNLGIAYHLRIDDFNAISAGLLGGAIQSSVSPDKLRWNNQYTPSGYDPTIYPNENIDASRVTPDFGAGLLYTFGKVQKTITSSNETTFHVGLSVMHLNKPDQAFLYGGDPLTRRFIIHSGATLGITNTNISLCPSLVFMAQGKQHETTAGMLFRWEMKESSKITGFIKGSYFTAGAYYRFKDAFSPYIGFQFSAYSLGISYDVNTSGMTTLTKGRGGIEVSLRIYNPNAYTYQNK